MADNQPLKNVKLHCPRCKGLDLVIYDKSFDCINCKMEFLKKDLEQFDDEDILSLKEKKSFIRNTK